MCSIHVKVVSTLIPVVLGIGIDRVESIDPQGLAGHAVRSLRLFLATVLGGGWGPCCASGEV